MVFVDVFWIRYNFQSREYITIGYEPIFTTETTNITRFKRILGNYSVTKIVFSIFSGNSMDFSTEI